MSDESTKSKPADRTVGNDDASTSNNKNGKKSNVPSGNFLRNRHPELFQYTPRPGGFYRHLAPGRSAFRPETEVATSRTEAKKNVGAENRADISAILETNIRCSSARTNVSKADLQNDMVKICSTAISTVMMLAQKSYDDITAEHIRHTEEYFRSLKQSDGYPQNVRQLLQLLANLKTDGKIVTPLVDADDPEFDEENDENDEETIGRPSDVQDN